MNEKVIVACQLPVREPFVTEARYLFQSLSEFGGLMSNAKKIACFSESINNEIQTTFQKLDVAAKSFTSTMNSPHSNKIEMLSMTKNENYDFLVCLDTDILIAKDFFQFVDADKIRCKPVDDDPLSMEQWEKLYKFFNLPLPLTRYKTSLSLKETIPYFNTGVLIIPKKYAEKLYHAWKHFIVQLENLYKKHPDISKYSFFTDQFAFSLAVSSEKLPYSPLPLSMNFPTHIQTHPSLNPESCMPYIIHYHHKFEPNGKISHSLYPNINKIIDRINENL